MKTFAQLPKLVCLLGLTVALPIVLDSAVEASTVEASTVEASTVEASLAAESPAEPIYPDYGLESFSQFTALPLSPGDRIKILVQDGELFSGIYEVNIDGDLQLPYMLPIQVLGLNLAEVEQLIQTRLVQEKLFQPGFARVSVGIVQWAEIAINVSGAVFQPGLLVINARSAEEQALQNNITSGDYTTERSLVAALRAAGGITPHADVKQITVVRNQQARQFDLSGVLDGQPVEDIALVRGDQVIVPKLETWQNELVRPSAITLPAIQIRVSNLTVPASSNSGSSLTRDAITFPYGSRFTSAVISANCVGGTKSANAARRAILVRTDRETGVTTVYERSIEDLIRDSTDATNPFLMPDDGVACYDSNVSEIRDVARTLLDVITPLNIIYSIFDSIFD
jgi:polysaccharide biosynthesis/export protein